MKPQHMFRVTSLHKPPPTEEHSLQTPTPATNRLESVNPSLLDIRTRIIDCLSPGRKLAMSRLGSEDSFEKVERLRKEKEKRNIKQYIKLAYQRVLPNLTQKTSSRFRARNHSELWREVLNHEVPRYSRYFSKQQIPNPEPTVSQSPEYCKASIRDAKIEALITTHTQGLESESGQFKSKKARVPSFVVREWKIARVEKLAGWEDQFQEEDWGMGH